MRETFIKALTEIARRDRDVILLTGDLGFGVLTQFAKELPDQYLNVGVAEQNMMGIATGLALEGKKVFAYSIGNFSTLRCLEQIRNDICYHNVSVKIVSVGGGFCYGPLGISHHATEDLAILRSLPYITVVAPGDTYETEKATFAAYEKEGPFYLRLGRGNEPLVHDTRPAFSLGVAIPLTEDREITLISTGGILANVMRAHEILKDQGIYTSVYSMHTVKPIDASLIVQLAQTARLIITVEEHTILGGLGGAVAEVLSGYEGFKPRLVRIGLQDQFSSEVGDQDYLRMIYGLSPESIAACVQASIPQ